MTWAKDEGPRRRRRLLSGGLLALSVIGVLGAAVVAVATPSTREADAVKDKAGLAVVRERLAAALDDVNGVTPPSSSRAAGAAYVTDCAVDSGEVFEPALYREWRLLGPARSPKYDRVTDAGRGVGSSIAAELIEQGWSGSPRLEGEDFPFTRLTKGYDGYKVALTIQVFDRAVLVSGGTKHARVCHSHL